MNKNYTTLKYACYTGNISMAVIVNLSPLLFLTFRSLYGISYSLLGFLVLINYVTQLTIDIVFSFFSHKFNISKSIKITPILTFAGLCIYSLWSYLFPDMVYVGLVIGTILFSASSGLCEVLLSPIIASIPSDDPDGEMSKLHSVYAWGVVGVVILSTLFLLLVGNHHWQWLALFFLIIPICSFILFSSSEIPDIPTPQKSSQALGFLKSKGVLVCAAAMFLGGASECVMAQWCSGYLEKALSIPKTWGDIFGVALFALMLGLGRSLSTKICKTISKILFVGGIGATVCYLVAAVSSVSLIGLIACALTGLFVAMMWPGTLIIASDKYPESGVLIYALMAASGDCGASVGPQLVGVVTDFAVANKTFVEMASYLNLSPDQLGLKLGMLTGMIFPLLSIPVYYSFMKKPPVKNH